MILEGHMSQFAKFIKFTEMLSDAEKELGIDHLSGLISEFYIFLRRRLLLAAQCLLRN